MLERVEKKGPTTVLAHLLTATSWEIMNQTTHLSHFWSPSPQKHEIKKNKNAYSFKPVSIG